MLASSIFNFTHVFDVLSLVSTKRNDGLEVILWKKRAEILTKL